MTEFLLSKKEEVMGKSQGLDRTTLTEKGGGGGGGGVGWLGEAKVSRILRHWSVHLILAYSWARLTLAVG